jgi:hypothetical protein
MMVESVRFIGRDAHTVADLTMMRLEDVFFRDNTPEPVNKIERKGPQTIPNTTVFVSAIATTESRLLNAPGLGTFQYPPSGLDVLDTIGSDGSEATAARNPLTGGGDDGSLKDPPKDPGT